MATAVSSSLNICVFLIIGTGIVLMLICVAFDSHRGEINSIHWNTGRVKRSASESIPDIHPEALSSILEFTTANIRRITHQQKANEDPKELEVITNQLANGLDDDIQSIQNNLKKVLNVTIDVFDLKKRVSKSLTLFRQHLGSPKVQKYIDDFKKEAATLPETLQALLDGRLLGRNSATIDVIASLRDAFQCHGPNLQKKFKSMMRIFMAGFWVYFKYRWMNISNKSSSSFKTSDVMLSSEKLLKRLDEEVSLCRTDERNVTAEMERTILETRTIPRNVTTMARALLRSLEDKYDTKKWIVVVLSKDFKNGEKIAYPVECVERHRTDTDGFIAIAISVDRIGNPQFGELVWARLNDSMRQNEKPEVKSIHDRSHHMDPAAEPNPNKEAADDYLYRISESLEKMKKGGGFCYLIIWKNCNMSDMTIITSNNATWAKKILFQDIKCFGSIQLFTLAVNKTTVYANTVGLLQKQEIQKGMKLILDSVALRRDRVGAADALHQFLEDIFSSTRKWIVVVINDTKTVDNFQSGGVYTASAGGLFAAAVSIKRSDEDPQVWEMFKDRLENFKFPIETIVDNKTHSLNERTFLQKRKDGAYVIHQMLNNYLFPPLSTCGNIEVESMAITTPYTGTRRSIFDYTTIVGTSDLKWLPMAEQDECAQMLIISLPIRTGLAMPFNGPQYYRSHFSSNVSERIDLLRNEYGQVYLSVERNSNKDNTRINVDGRWIDSKSQKWQFVNNKLKNGHGKCLTARTKESQVLYQQTCLADSFPGQTWTRQGLQIVNGFNLCLALKNKEKSVVSSNYVVIQDLCDTTPPFLWYNWDVNLEDAINVHPTGNGSRALRNYFSRRYLSVSLEGKVRHEQWSNQPGQNWQVVNKQLRNGQGINCLTNNSTFLIRQQRCASGEQKAKIWTLNANGQIVCAHNKCLSVGDKNGFVTCVSCNKNSKQYWHYENSNLKMSKIYTN